MSKVCEILTDFFEEYLAENIGEEILAQYHEGFTVDQVAHDLFEGIKEWANDKNNPQALVELVEECADEYLSEDVEG